MNIITPAKPKVEAEATQPAVAAEPALQGRIDAIIAEAIRNAPPPLSVEEQRTKNQAAIDMLKQRREENATDDPKELARGEADWQEFKKSINEKSLSGRIIYPAEDYP